MNRKNNSRANITVPNSFNKVIARKGIADILDNITHGEMCYFVAPYGYGKTVSVVSWLRQRQVDAIWITLTSSDDSEQDFYAIMSAAMMRYTGWQGSSDEILTNPNNQKNLHEFLWDAVSAIEKSEQEKILVIDNFGFIRDRDLLRSVKAIITELLGRWRIIIMSRMEIPGVFTDLVLRGQIHLVTAKELGFNPAEIVEFFEINNSSALQEEILHISRETEGWPAALNAVVAVSRGGSVVYREAAREYVMVFFENEIWNTLEEEMKIFLLKTSILDKLTPVICRIVTNIGETLPILRRLFVSGLLISRLDENESYRYHRVFQDYLLNKLSASDIDERELNRKLGWWLFDNNKIEKSFTCFFKAGDLYGLSQALKMLRLTEIGGIEKFVELAGCIKELDVNELKQYPLIVARIALISFVTGDITRMQALYRLFCEWSEPGVLSLSPEDYSEFMWETGWLCLLDPYESSKENEKHKQWANLEGYRNMSVLEEREIARTSVLYFPSMMKGVRDYSDDGIFLLKEILDRIEAGEKNLVDKELSQWLMYLLLAEYNYEREKFEDAEKIAWRIMYLAKESQLTFVYFIGVALLVKIIRAAHNPKEIGDLSKQLETMITQNKHTFLLPNFHAFELRNMLADGYAGFTEIFEKENKDYEDKRYYYLIYRHITLVRGLLSLENYSRAMLILENLEILCQSYNRPTDLAEVNILKSIALYGLGYEDDACQHLIKAIRWAEKFGYIRMFSDDAKNIWPVLELARKRVTGKHMQKIIISCKKTLTRSGYKLDAKKNPLVALTKTELKILEAARNGMSYQEIAQDNGIRMSTVKSHLHSVYSKLEVSNKTEAIIEAQNMGILK